MKIAVKPINVSHESILAIKLHQEVLAAEYSRLVKIDRGNKLQETKKAMQVLREKMSDCKKAEAILDKWLQNLKTKKKDEHTSKNEALQRDEQS